MSGEYQTPEQFGNREKIKTREVFTGDANVIGPDDDADNLEALPVTCAILTAARPEQHTVGLAHFGLGLRQRGTSELMNQFAHKLQRAGVTLSDCRLRMFSGDEMQWQEIKEALHSYNATLPEPEFLQLDGIRINKHSGEVSFFSLLPKDTTEEIDAGIAN